MPNGRLLRDLACTLADAAAVTMGKDVRQATYDTGLEVLPRVRHARGRVDRVRIVRLSLLPVSMVLWALGVSVTNTTTLGSYGNLVSLENGQPHELLFSRDAQGNMTLSLDGKQVVTAKDTSLKGDMTGLLFVNSGGAYYLREVKVTAN